MAFIPDLDQRLVDLVHSTGFVPLALVVAFGAGAAHAVAPGHGKSLAAAYLVGSHGRVRDAAWLGGSVAVMHTLSVLVIGLAWTFFSLSDLVRMEQLTSGLQVVGGLTVIAVGGWLLRRHVRGRGHSHDHTHDHTHPAGPSRPGLLALGAAGGLTPSPAAFLVLVTGIFTGRSGLALVLVLAFGLGLASVLFVVGLLALTGRDLVVRVGGSRAVVARAAHTAPLVAATSITVLGCGITGVAVSNLIA